MLAGENLRNSVARFEEHQQNPKGGQLHGEPGRNRNDVLLHGVRSPGYHPVELGLHDRHRVPWPSHVRRGKRANRNRGHQVRGPRRQNQRESRGNHRQRTDGHIEHGRQLRVHQGFRAPTRLQGSGTRLERLPQPEIRGGVKKPNRSFGRRTSITSEAVLRNQMEFLGEQHQYLTIFFIRTTLRPHLCS